MPTPDETTSLVPVARTRNWRQKCCKFFYWSCYFAYFLLLFVGVVGRIMFTVVISIVTPLSFQVYLGLVEGIVFNFIDALICWILLGIVARSPRFVGFFKILKNLIHLPKFWTLVSLLVLYIIGAALSLRNFFSSTSQNQDAKINVIVVIEIVMQVLNAFTKVALVGGLNYVQVRNVASSPFKYSLLKTTLKVICFFQMYTLISAMLLAYSTFLLPITTGNYNYQVQQPGDSFPRNLIQPLYLPLITRTAELIFTKTLQDNKCIIGKNENNISDASNESSSFTRQRNPVSQTQS